MTEQRETKNTDNGERSPDLTITTQDNQLILKLILKYDLLLI